MLKSIRWRLVISYLFLAVVIVATVGLLAMWAAGRYVQRQEIEHLTTNAQNIAEQAASLLARNAAPEELDQLAAAASFFGDVRVRILDSNRDLLADSDLSVGGDDFAWFVLTPKDIDEFINVEGLEGWIVSPFSPEFLERFFTEGFSRYQLMPRAMMRSLPDDGSGTIIRRSNSPWGSLFYFDTGRAREVIEENLTSQIEDPGERSREIVTVPVGDEDQPLGYIELSGGVNYRSQALATTRQALLIAGSGAVILAVLIGLVMGRRISAPITELTRVSQSMSSGDLSARADVREGDELGTLGSQFNQMADQLETSFAQLAAERDALRRFIADASHELRTPITALKNFNELLRGPALDDPQAQQEFLAESKQQIDRLAWITDNLLDLSRLDAGIAALDFAMHDINEIIQAVLPPFRNRFAEKGIRVTLKLDESLPGLQCDRARLESAVSNLIDNAVKFSDQGGEIEIGSQGSQESIQVWVKDHGQGIPEETQPHIFERFYRGPDNDQGGSGLGLSIVQSTVNAHRGSIKVESRAGEGSCFTITLPLAEGR